MNKFIKIAAVALFSLFVAACNKADPKADFKKLTDWSVAQQQAQLDLQKLQLELQQKVATQDLAQIEPTLDQFNTKIAEMQKSLEAVDVKSPEIKALKDKMISTWNASKDLMIDGLNAMKNPQSIDQKALMEKTQNAVKSAEELQKLQVELQQKFGQ
ncbi:hypothetical protein EDC44_10716 [Cricetibacter osteomyelitidis]|uniref:Lipoprotein HlpB n=1 Tax=Cricetibacter osteomyelitidis TaxID=1521931 RepID=A0A4R2SYY5_9PAST|nr:hypothetical protein [Cricetibacter osteomyelitidis]TCP95737.1 hypothetical protein EDC44_10716 [Cricetibacter osteomyelitidis]